MRRAPFIVALLVVCSGLVPVSVVGASLVDADPQESLVGGDPAPVAQQSTPGVGSETSIVVQLRKNRNARWTVELRYPLETDAERAAFRKIEREYESGDSSVGIEPTVFRAAADGASKVADRKMQIRNVNRSGEIASGTGVLRLTFTWTNFLGNGQNETLVLRDAFLTPGNRTWLQSLEGDQELVVRTPPGYFISTNPGLPQRSDSLIVDGPQQFEEPGALTIEYRPLDQPPVPWELVIGGAVVAVVAVALVGGFLFFRRDGSDERETPAAASDPAGDDGDDRVANSAGGGAATADAGESADDGVDTSLLSDEERVEHLLERNGGRMKQANIVRETGWSDAKVSQLLSSMAEDGRVEKLRLGRENLISLPDAEERGEE
jgi:hypothetical protein